MADIALRLLLVQRGQLIARGDTLIKLPKLGPSEHRLQLRLPGQNNLQQFFFVCFEVSQQPDLFQNLKIKMLSLIDHQDRLTSFSMIGEQKPMEGIGQHLQAWRLGRIADFELITNARQQLNGT